MPAMPDPVVRVSVPRCDAARSDRFRAMMAGAEAVLRPGIEAMPGLLAFNAGADEATSPLTNTSVWQTLEHAKRLDRFEPMLEPGRRFAAEGAASERPIVNHAALRRFGILAGR